MISLSTKYKAASWSLSLLSRFVRYTLGPMKILQSRVKEPFPHPYKTISIKPKEIKYFGGCYNRKPYKHGGNFSLAYWSGAEVKKGDWDKNLSKIEDMEKYTAIKLRFQEDKEWSETGIYEYIEKKIEESNDPAGYDGCKSRDDIRKRYHKIDRLYKNIRDEGYKKSNHLDEVCVNIGRNGEVIFNGQGKHRLSIAKILGLEYIPVRILVRHHRWQRLREHVSQASHYKDLNEKAKANLTHPDLNDVAP